MWRIVKDWLNFKFLSLYSFKIRISSMYDLYQTYRQISFAHKSYQFATKRNKKS